MLQVTQYSKGNLQIKTLKNASLFQTWITRALINTAHDHRRKALSTLSQEDSAIDSAHASTANQQIPSVEHFDLQTAIETLPDKYRIPILLKYFSGMTVDEIAWTLSIPSGSVKAYLSRGRNELKQKLKEDIVSMNLDFDTIEIPEEKLNRTIQNNIKKVHGIHRKQMIRHTAGLFCAAAFSSA